VPGRRGPPLWERRSNISALLGAAFSAPAGRARGRLMASVPRRRPPRPSPGVRWCRSPQPETVGPPAPSPHRESLLLEDGGLAAQRESEALFRGR